MENMGLETNEPQQPSEEGTAPAPEVTAEQAMDRIDRADAGATNLNNLINLMIQQEENTETPQGDNPTCSTTNCEIPESISLSSEALNQAEEIAHRLGATPMDLPVNAKENLIQSHLIDEGVISNLENRGWHMDTGGNIYVITPVGEVARFDPAYMPGASDGMTVFTSPTGEWLDSEYREL